MGVTSSQPLVILVGADDAYAMPLAVTLFSALGKLPKGTAVKVYIIDGGIGDAHKARIKRVLHRVAVSLELVWLTPQNEVLRTLPPSPEKRISMATYLRLLAPYLIEEASVLYLDSDLVVTKDVTELWKTDLKGHAVAAVRNLGIPATVGESLNWQEQSLQKNAPYFNAGVMLMDLDRWRTHKLSERVLDNIRTYGKYYKFADQDALNAVLQNDWLELGQVWNAQVNDAAFIQNPRSINELGIIHYTMNFKPWQWVALGPSRTYHTVFFHSLARSSWFSKGEYALFRARLLLTFFAALPQRLVKRIRSRPKALEETHNDLQQT